MRPLFVIGLVVLVLGIFSFVVPIPMSHSHDAKIGDATIDITTHSSERLSPIVGVVLCFAGAGLLIAGSRKSA